MTPTHPPTACAQQVLQLLPHLTRWARKCAEQAGADVDLSLRQYAALRGIREGASSAGELARRWQVTPAVITGILDRLERRGLVRRKPDPSDRRRLNLALTEEGLAASRSVEDALTGQLAAQLATASLADVDALTHALSLLERSIDALEGGGVSPRAGTKKRQASPRNSRTHEGAPPRLSRPARPRRRRSAATVGSTR